MLRGMVACGETVRRINSRSNDERSPPARTVRVRVVHVGGLCYSAAREFIRRAICPSSTTLQLEPPSPLWHTLATFDGEGPVGCKWVLDCPARCLGRVVSLS